MPAVKKPTIIQQEEIIIKVFKKALIDKGWKMQHLAKLCRCSPQRISQIVNHPMTVQLDTVLMVASKLGIETIPIL